MVGKMSNFFSGVRHLHVWGGVLHFRETRRG